MRSLPRGLSILETMIALVILGVGLLGVLGALERAAVESRLGQNRQQKVMLADATLQRFKLLEKTTFFAQAAATPTVDPLGLAVGTAPWLADPTDLTAAEPLDLSTGAYFNILPDGTITKLSLPGNPPCSAVPQGVVCREILTHAGPPFGTGLPNGAACGSNTDCFSKLCGGGVCSLGGGVTGLGTQVATTWVRVVRRPSDTLPAEVDVTLNQVVVR
jgi:prepilin-type N-terminal cleavage/methylation domain-containing protein